MAQACVYFTGLETGDPSEITTLGSGNTVQSTTVRSGGYALKLADSSFSQLCANTFLAATQSVIRVYLQVPVLPGALTTLITERTGATSRFRLRFNASNHLQIDDQSATAGLTLTAGTASFVTGAWYRIEVAIDLTAGGVVKVWVTPDSTGVSSLDINTTHTTDVSASVTGNYTLLGFASPHQYFYDDIRIDTGGVAQIGAGQIIARQGTAGTPHTDSWTKTGAATSALCWSDTPVNVLVNCSSAVSSASQSMLVAPFSATQSGHGTQVVGASDTVNACKFAIIGSAASSAAVSLVRRVNGVQTLTSIALTTSGKYFDDGIWSTTPANLDLLDMGVQKAANTISCLVDDVWVMVDYTPAMVVALAAFVSIACGARATPAGVAPFLARGATAVGANAAPKGSVSLSGRSVITATSRGTLTAGAALVALAGRAVAVVMASGKISAVAKMYGRSQANISAKGIAAGVVGLSARAGARSRGSATPAGRASLVGLSAAMIRAKGAISVAAHLAARTAATVRAKSTPAGRVSLNASGSIAVRSKPGAVFKAALSGFGSVQVSAGGLVSRLAVLRARAMVAMGMSSTAAGTVPLAASASIVSAAPTSLAANTALSSVVAVAMKASGLATRIAHLSAVAKSSMRGKATPAGKTHLSGRASVRVSGKPVMRGAARLAGRISTMVKAPARMVPKVVLAAAVAARIRMGGHIAGKAKLSAKGHVAAAGRDRLSGKVSLSARSAVKSSARGKIAGTVHLAARAAIKVKARAKGTWTKFMAARATVAAHARGATTRHAALLGRSSVKSAARATAAGVVPMFGRIATMVGTLKSLFRPLQLHAEIRIALGQPRRRAAVADARAMTSIGNSRIRTTVSEE